jgi:hypothetical protein
MRGLARDVEQFEDEAGPLRDALWYSDMVSSPDGQRMRFQDRIAEIQTRYGPGDLVSRFIRAAQADLSGAVQRTIERMATAGIDQPKYGWSESADAANQYVMSGNSARACSNSWVHVVGQPKARRARSVTSPPAAPLVKWRYPPQFRSRR